MARSDDVPRIVAHRGLHGEHAENSLGAFAAAWEAGIAWCECDVWESADGELVLMHDKTIDRTADGAGPVAEMMWNQLRGYRLRNARGELTGDRIPLLRDVLEAMPAWGGMLVELKVPDDAGMVKRTLELIGERRCLVQSFYEPALRHARALQPERPLAFLIGRKYPIEAAIAGEWPMVHMDHRMADKPVVAELRRRGKGVGVWTVDEPDEVRRVLSLGVDMIITDDPMMVRRIVEEG